MKANVETANNVNALASTTATDRATMASLSSSIQTITVQLSSTQKQLDTT